MAGELKAVQEAGAKLKTARTAEDTLNAMMGVQEMNTMAAGAQAAGLEQERYKFVRSNLSGVVQYLTPAQGGVDTTMLSSAQRVEMRQMNEAQIRRMQGEVPAQVFEPGGGAAQEGYGTCRRSFERGVCNEATPFPRHGSSDVFGRMQLG
jgi:hypothetical protein